MTAPPEPVFILCPGRSFSSVVCAALGEHPQMYGLPELYLFTADTVGGLFEVAEERGSHVLHGLMRVLAQLHEGDQGEEAVARAWDWLDQRAAWTTAAVYRHLAEAVAPRRCIDKTPSYGHPRNLERLWRAFPHARFLHLARHPRPTGQSLLKTIDRKRRGGGANPAMVEDYWYRAHRAIIDFTAQLPPGQSLYLQGEAFLTAPDDWLRQICVWLGLDWGEAALAAMKHPETSPYARPGPINAPYGNNPGFLDDPRLRIGAPAPASLKGALDWMPDDGGFAKPTIDLARRLGYH